MARNRIVLGAVLAAVALSLPFYGRNWNHFMHVLGAVLFLGNLIVTAVWMALARRSRHPESLRLGVQGVLLTDHLFTTPGAILLLINGGILAAPYFKTSWHWLAVGIALFVASGVVYGSTVVPAQKKLGEAMSRMPTGGPVPPEVEALMARWFRCGGIATVLPLVALWFMVFKPAF
jgi:uncharacterized membrane protein